MNGRRFSLVAVIATWWIDFDGGVLNTTVDSAKDMQFEVPSTNYRALIPNDGALILKMGTSRPSCAT